MVRVVFSFDLRAPAAARRGARSRGCGVDVDPSKRIAGHGRNRRGARLFDWLAQELLHGRRREMTHGGGSELEMQEELNVLLLRRVSRRCRGVGCQRRVGSRHFLADKNPSLLPSVFFG